MEKESCLIIPQRYLEENPIYKEKTAVKMVLMAEIYTAMVEMYTALWDEIFLHLGGHKL